MNPRARRVVIALALLAGGLAVAAAWLAQPSPSAAWPDEADDPEDVAARGVPSLAELEVASRGPGGAAGGSGTLAGRRTSDDAPTIAGGASPGGASGSPTQASSARALTPDAGVRTRTRLEALLHAAGLVDDERKDPQLSAFEQLRDLPTGAPFEAITREGRVVTARGEAPVPVGALCQLRVLPARKDAFDCAVLAVCGGVIVYPDPRAAGGLNTCVYEDDGRPRATIDAHPTEVDGDPRLTLDLTEGLVTIEEVTPAFTLRIVVEGGSAPTAPEVHDE